MDCGAPPQFWVQGVLPGMSPASASGETQTESSSVAMIFFMGKSLLGKY